MPESDERGLTEIDGEVVDLAAPEGTDAYERAQTAVMRAGAAEAATETDGISGGGVRAEPDEAPDA